MIKLQACSPSRHLQQHVVQSLVHNYVLDFILVQSTEYVNDSITSVERALNRRELKHELYRFGHSSSRRVFSVDRLHL